MDLKAVVAIGIIGSRAEDPYSDGDWDLVAFIDAPNHPPPDIRREFWVSTNSPLAGAEIHCSGMCDRFIINGSHVGIDYRPIDSIAADIKQVLEEGTIWQTPDISFVLGCFPEAICADIRMCIPLWDPEDRISAWQASLKNYPEKFRNNIIQQVLFEARFKLADLRRASEISDVTFFHAALSEFCLCLIRIIFALNRRYFRGLKRAMHVLIELRIKPNGVTERLTQLMSSAFVETDLWSPFEVAKQLAVDVAMLAASQGDTESTAAGLALSDWPDAEPLKFNQISDGV